MAVSVPIVLVAAVALIDPDGRVLLAERPSGKNLAGLWEFPGGKVQPGETPEAALIREAETDSSFRRRIGEAAARVRAMKKAHASSVTKMAPLSRDVVGSFEHKRLADRLAGRV